MKFKAKETNVTYGVAIGKIYYGALVHVSSFNPGVRVCVYTDHKKWSTFDPNMFEPVRDKLEPYSAPPR